MDATDSASNIVIYTSILQVAAISVGGFGIGAMCVTGTYKMHPIVFTVTVASFLWNASELVRTLTFFSKCV